MEKYLIIADDFTGSNDTGVQMKKRGIPTEVVLFPEELKEVKGSMVLDTESRNMPKEESYEKVKDMVQKVFATAAFDIVFKKVDSTIRGNIKEELKAVQELYKADRIVFAPAFPKIGRTTAGAIHYLNGVRILETEMSKDPYNPVVEDDISRILTDVDGDVTHHALEEVRSGAIDFSKTTSHTFDCEEVTDLVALVRAATQTGEKILWVGSAGLADALFDTIVPDLPSLAIVGSISQVSEKQIGFAEFEGAPVVLVPAQVLLLKEGLSGYADQVVAHLKAGENTVLTSSKRRSDYEASIDLANTMGISGKEASKVVQESLGQLAKEILEKTSVSGIFLTGGDTAISVIRSLQSSGSNIVSEFTTGVVISELNGGAYAGLPIITKAGAFGTPETIHQSLSRLKEYI